MQTLRFEVTNTAPYPVTVSNQADGTGAAITVCALEGDPFVAFLAQTPQDDEIVYLSLGLDTELKRDVTPSGRPTVIGMGYHEPSERIWCASNGAQQSEVFALDPLTGLETDSMDWSNYPDPQWIEGFGVANNFFLRSDRDKLEMFTMNGFRLGERTYPGKFIQGVSSSPASWTFVDRNASEIVVIGPFGNIVATAPAPGNPAGAAAIAYDSISQRSNMPQIIPPQGILGPVGSPMHPDTPWDPTPWLFRHRLYYVDAADQMIYGGYLTADP